MLWSLKYKTSVRGVRGVRVAESYYFYNKDLQGSTTNVLNSVGQSEVAYEYTYTGEYSEPSSLHLYAFLTF
ncbi:hypothetical protein Q604_UNBc4C00088G0002, partial [human gut metagenome]